MSALPASLAHLPQPDADACARSALLRARVLEAIDRDGFLPFARFMALALYEPGLGYYAAGDAKFGRAGDFVTAPELTPFFGAALAAQVAELVAAGCDDVLELGAGSGRLAADILRGLERLGRLPRRYAILEVSGELAARQRDLIARELPHLVDRVQWLDRLPDRIRGVVLGNEVLDALPVELVVRRGGTVYELGVTRGSQTREALAWSERTAAGELRRAAERLQLPEGYRTEIHLAAQALVRTLGESLEHGVLLLLDYGFPRREYYHPQRDRGTLMCHYRHYAHDDPLVLVGLQDITAHVDFSAIAEAALETGLDLIGFTSQARFLVNCGILELLARVPVDDTVRYAKAAAAVQKLLSPAEMGELFKAIAFGRGIDVPLVGFRRGDRSGALEPQPQGGTT